MGQLIELAENIVITQLLGVNFVQYIGIAEIKVGMEQCPACKCGARQTVRFRDVCTGVAKAEAAGFMIGGDYDQRVLPVFSPIQHCIQGVVNKPVFFRLIVDCIYELNLQDNDRLDNNLSTFV